MRSAAAASLLLEALVRPASRPANEQAAAPANSSDTPTQTITAVVPNTSGWKIIHSAQSSSSTPLAMVQPEPGTRIACISPPRPMALKPRNRSQKPRKTGSETAESAVLNTRINPSTISMIPPASIHPRPVMKWRLAAESTTCATPEKKITHPKISAMPT